MIIKHNDLKIPVDNPFENCKLDRKKYAEILTEIVNQCNDGFVLAINNEWGTGKTTFVKMWQQLLVNQEFKTLYFNAWENDFELNPLTAILAELKKLFPKTNSKNFNTLLNKGAVIAQNVLPAIAKGIAKRYIDADEITEGIEKTTKAVTDIMKDEIKSYTARQKGMDDFRKELEKFVKQEGNLKPVIFFIDELDRCKPSYSVEVLEQMKHFFMVSGIVFVLAIDKVQLGNAIKGFYGSEHINSEEYLRRFIDIEYTIPEPSLSSICNYFYDYYKFDEFFQNDERKKYNELRLDKEQFLDVITLLFENKYLTLRQQEKLFGHARLSLISFAPNNYVFPSAFMLLIYIKSFHGDIYSKIKSLKFTPQELVDEIENIFPQIISKKYFRFLLFTEAIILFTYHNAYLDIHQNVKLIKEDTTDGNSICLLKSKFDPSEGSSSFLNLLQTFERGRMYSLKLEYLLNKIDLLSNINN